MRRKKKSKLSLPIGSNPKLNKKDADLNSRKGRGLKMAMLEAEYAVKKYRKRNHDGCSDLSNEA